MIPIPVNINKIHHPVLFKSFNLLTTNSNAGSAVNKREVSNKGNNGILSIQSIENGIPHIFGNSQSIHKSMERKKTRTKVTKKYRDIQFCSLYH